MDGNKIPINVRLSAEAIRLLDEIKAEKGISRTAVLELAVRDFAKRNTAATSDTAKSSE